VTPNQKTKDATFKQSVNDIKGGMEDTVTNCTATVLKIGVTANCIKEVRETKNQNCMRGRNLFADLTPTTMPEHDP